ncbi:hypothetical protein GJR96_02940 [Haloferax sp. MBLA0076]|uniref:Uncharacterized protein n=1 Tax=Haloferax litoreum TaxID=2666140 RepID=A0A6A8GCW2_9EURY|nr:MULTISPECIES: hypothetical protein [Haloferax]KAB1192448.1 hypothetical protein Hfx1148_02935 [Haloferax sp. CBA1148]MRX20915.1 hypothetical protein [Haloferax litoreum]
MTGPSDSDSGLPLGRRSALKLTGGFFLASALGGQVAANQGDGEATKVYRVTQGSREYEISLLTGDTPATELYDLRIPDQYGGDNGATDPGEGPYYESVGLSYLLEEQESLMFLYDGPNGISLVVLHGGPGDGSAVTWRLTGVPSGATWLVKDDLYTYPDTGEQAVSNYDRWDVSGSEHTIDWTWDGGRTDGGVLGYLSGEFSFAIYPAYNTAAALYGEYFSGLISGWYVLTGGWNSLTREPLNLEEPVTITCETVEEPEQTPETPDPTETPEEETPQEEEENEEDDDKRDDQKKDESDWKDKRDEAREEWKEKRDEWQESRDDGDDDWKEERDEAREERKEKREEWQESRDEEKERDDDEDEDEDKDEEKKGNGKAKGKDKGSGNSGKKKGKGRSKRGDDDDDD